MIILVLSIITFGLASQSCTKDSDEKAACTIPGNVIGANYENCDCCPGWLISDGDDTLKFENVPDNELLQDLVNFFGYPIPITFNYKDDIGQCADSYKIMTCIVFSINTDCPKSGEIIGYNGTECACCPGWIIKTGNDTIKVMNFPIESQIIEIANEEGFPIPIKFDYENITGPCEDFYKKITCAALIN